ncbi:MAG: hypothetical protein UT69_C0010G0012 [Candidatus Yanofskybacteria bacterium GW2011_GWE1_40_10]|nr:MAG: hypothetical protein UT69_C0010G0012 [Candidatus Yanofskybacteria bacterium GW2011_GWE1_40_10]
MDNNDEYKNHHYVPQWYQKKFMLPGESELFYLDMKPNFAIDSKGNKHQKRSLWKQGSKKCFVEELNQKILKSISLDK